MDSPGIRKIDTHIDDAPVKNSDVSQPLEKKTNSDVSQPFEKKADPSAGEMLLRELEEKNRRFNKLKKQGLIAEKDVEEIQKDLRNTIKELKTILDSLPEIEEA